MGFTEAEYADMVASEIDERVVEVSIIEEGIGDAAMVVTTEGEYVVKAYSGAGGSVRGSIAGARILSSEVNQSIIPSPRVVEICDATDRERATSFYIMEFVEGDYLDISEAGENMFKQSLAQIGLYLAELHQLDVSFQGSGWVRVNDGECQTSHRNHQFTEMLSERFAGQYKNLIEQTRSGDFAFPDLLPLIAEVNERTRQLDGGVPSSYVLCHPDLKRTNVFITDTSGDWPRLSIIDWDGLMFTPAVFSIARAEWGLIGRREAFGDVSKEQADEFRAQFRAGYEQGIGHEIHWNNPRVQCWMQLGAYYKILFMLEMFEPWFGDDSNSEKSRREAAYRHVMAQVAATLRTVT